LEPTGLETQIVANILLLERLVRLGLAAAFGISLVAYARVLLLSQNEGRPRDEREMRQGRSVDDARTADTLNPTTALRLSNLRLWQIASRLSFQLGTAFTVAYATLAAVSPQTPVALLVYLGVALVIAMATLLLDRFPRTLPALSFLSSGLIWLLVVLASYLMPSQGLDHRPIGALAWAHIATATLASGLFIAAFLASCLYLIGYRWLKTRQLEGRPRLPSLEFLDNLVERTSVVGLFLITTSLVSGLGLIFTGTPLASVGTAKLVWAFAVWGLYSVSIFGRGFWGWRGRRGALFSVWGTLLIAGSLFGTLLRTP